MHIIGLAGPAGCGKSIIGEYLWLEHGYEEFSFAQPLRTAVVALLGSEGFKDEQVEWAGCTPRQLMCYLGAFLRERDPLFLIKRLRNDKFFRTANCVVITDVRLDTEANFIRHLGGMIWYVYREGYGYDTNKDVTEHGVQAYPEDWTLENIGAIEELHKAIEELLDETTRHL